MRKDAKTLVNIKLRAGRRAHELWALTKILVGFALILIAIAAIQVAFCAGEEPPRGFRACMAPVVERIKESRR